MLQSPTGKVCPRDLCVTGNGPVQHMTAFISFTAFVQACSQAQHVPSPCSFTGWHQPGRLPQLQHTASCQARPYPTPHLRWCKSLQWGNKLHSVTICTGVTNMKNWMVFCCSKRMGAVLLGGLCHAALQGLCGPGIRVCTHSVT